MMATINDGGPAFPVLTGTLRTSESEMLHAGHMGLSLRDWFAAKALNGMLAHSKRYKPRPGASDDWHQAIAEEAYELADAMLATCTPEPSA